MGRGGSEGQDGGAGAEAEQAAEDGLEAVDLEILGGDVRVRAEDAATNEIVGYDMSQPTPREIARLATVQSPYTLGVDSTTGKLFVAGVTAGVVQIIDAPA